MKTKVLVLMLILSMPLFSVPSVKAPTTYLADLSKWDSIFRIPTFTIATTSITSRNTLDFYQFNITLSRAIGISSISIAIETSNLAFYYQPPLNLELIGKEYEGWKINATHAIDDKGVLRNYRPLNVVGSYAVYSTTKRNNQYTTGKLFHIYRPLIVDAKGKTSWATLNMTKTALTITVNQTFLASATYPVTVDPTFGLITKGGTQDGRWGADRKLACKYTLSVAGSVTEMKAYLKAEGSTNTKAYIYSDNAGTPNAKLATSNEVAVLAEGWYTYTISASLTAANYWLVIHYDSAGGGIFWWYDAGATNQFAWNNDIYSDGASNPFGAANYLAESMSIYATYTAGGQDLTFSLSQTVTPISTLVMQKEKGFSLSETAHLTSSLIQQKELSFPLSVTVKATSTLTMNKEILVVIHEWLYSLQETAHLTSNLYTDLEIAEKVSLGLGFYIGVLALVIALMAYLHSRH